MIDAEQKVIQARELWLSGCSCSQSVLAAFAPEMGISKSQALKLASGFGGGIGGLRVFCGALSAAFMVLGYQLGYDDPLDDVHKKWLYSLERKAAEQFTEAYGTFNCGELLKKAGVLIKADPSPRTAEYYANRPCGLYVEKAVRIVVDILNQET